MKKVSKFAKSFLFISLWLIISSYLLKFWDIFHLKNIYFNYKPIFYAKFWFTLDRYLFGVDSRYWIENLITFLTLDIPKESFKFLPIFFYLKSIWIKR